MYPELLAFLPSALRCLVVKIPRSSDILPLRYQLEELAKELVEGFGRDGFPELETLVFLDLTGDKADAREMAIEMSP